jgi:RHS repeat-associated protein
MRRFLTVLFLDFAVVTTANAALQTNVVERHYDRFGRLAGISLNGERRTEIAYDEATGRIASMRVADADEHTNIVRGGICELSAFDLDGNQTNVVTMTGEWAVEYNGENRPVLWRRKSDGATIRMAYDRMGRRVRKNDETFVYDGYLNISQTIWDPTELIATRPLVWRGPGGNTFYFHDGNKNVADFVPASSESSARHYDYAPFGVSLLDAAVAESPWCFSSEFLDPDLSLSYYNYRYYLAGLGRWCRREPFRDLEIVPYVFCLNRPSEDADQLGLWIVKGQEYSDKKEIVETKRLRVDNARSALVDYDLVTLGGVLIPWPTGYIGYLRQSCRCTCKTYSAIMIREKVCRHFSRQVRFGDSEPCRGSVSGSYVEDLGWRGGVETRMEYQSLGAYVVWEKPIPNIQTAYECRETCALACAGQSRNPAPSQDETVDCSNLK